MSLVVLMENGKLSASLRRAAAFSLIRVERATPETVTELAKHVGSGDPLRVHALYGLGTICRRLRDAGEAARADAIVPLLVGVLRDATTPAAQVDALRGIANSGHEGALEAVRPFLDAKVGKVRAAAVDAIRLMRRPEVDAIIAERLSNGENDVKLAALDAISVREPTDVLVSALDVTAKGADKPATRLKAVRIIGHWLPKRPELKATLEAVAKSDEQGRLREAAKTALGS